MLSGLNPPETGCGNEPYFKRYFTTINPPMSKIIKITERMFKYLAINVLIGVPNFQIRVPTKKKRAERDKTEASTNTGKFILKTPAAIVNTL